MTSPTAFPSRFHDRRAHFSIAFILLAPKNGFSIMGVLFISIIRRKLAGYAGNPLDDGDGDCELQYIFGHVPSLV